AAGGRAARAAAIEEQQLLPRGGGATQDASGVVRLTLRVGCGPHDDSMTGDGRRNRRAVSFTRWLARAITYATDSVGRSRLDTCAPAIMVTLACQRYLNKALDVYNVHNRVDGK